MPLKDVSLRGILKRIKRHWNDPPVLYKAFLTQIFPKMFSYKREDGFYVLKEEWDNLVILDACRYDLFKETLKKFDLDGRLEKKISRGSNTPEFIENNFKGENVEEIIYVNSNPTVNLAIEKKLENKKFFKMVNVWEDYWDKKKETVLPKEVVKNAIIAKQMNPDRRMIIHFLQPHVPFIGEYEQEGELIQVAMEKGIPVAKKAYNSNLEIVFPHLKRLINNLRGKTVITSDHGNAFGEKITFLRLPIYGHPPGVHIPPLVEVPWFICE